MAEALQSIANLLINHRDDGVRRFEGAIMESVVSLRPNPIDS